MATDNFTGANGTQLTAYSANWKLGNALASDFVIDSNAVRTPFNRNVVMFVYYTGTFSSDQYAEAKLTQLGSPGAWMGLCVRGSAGAGYTLGVQPGGTWYVHKTVGYVLTDLANGTLTLATNDILRLEVQGTTITASKNGSVITTLTDASIASGAPGIYGQGQATSGTYTLLDDWVGADLSAAALQYWQYDWPHQLHARR